MNGRIRGSRGNAELEVLLTVDSVQEAPALQLALQLTISATWRSIASSPMDEGTS
jgi:hypothetical protein